MGLSTSKRVLVITDNRDMHEIFVTTAMSVHGAVFDYRRSASKVASIPELQPIDLKLEAREIPHEYDLVISLHCKQLFPASLVNSVRCVNVHPGYNPYNRGWYSQVWAILDGTPLGATIHEIDEEIDHGAIIAQSEVAVYETDTSLSAYLRVREAERDILETHLQAVVDGTYTTTCVVEEGTLHTLGDFRELCAIDLEEKLTFREMLDRLRALTHGNHRNAHYVTESGETVYVRVTLDSED